MKNGVKKAGAALLLAFALNGCALLENKGVLDPTDVEALCKDAAKTCSVSVLIGADENVRKACAIASALCLGTQPVE